LDDVNQPGTTKALPFKTITYAMTRATSARPFGFSRIYDTLKQQRNLSDRVPAGVLLISDDDEANNAAEPVSLAVDQRRRASPPPP